MTKILERLIQQLDTLVPFVTLSYEDVFQLLNAHRGTWFANNQNSLPEAYTTYKRQIVHSTIILGYSYFENFLCDLLTEILRIRPMMLPGAKKIEYSDIIDSPNKESLIDKLIKREIHELSYKSMADIIRECRQRYGFSISTEEEDHLIIASLVRNCVIHNSSCADARLAKYSPYVEGEQFALCATEVNTYGLMIRTLAMRMTREACENHGMNNNPLTSNQNLSN